MIWTLLGWAIEGACCLVRGQLAVGHGRRMRKFTPSAHSQQKWPLEQPKAGLLLTGARFKPQKRQGNVEKLLKGHI